MSRLGPIWRDPLLLILLVVMNGIVLVNAIRHDPEIGYDAHAHLTYAGVLAHLRLPTRETSSQFFSPPLSYLPPALLIRWGVEPLRAGKATQVLGLFWSLVVSFGVLAACERLRPGDATLKRMSLLLIAMLPAYYRTFALVRPEPLITALWVVAVLLAGETFAASRLHVGRTLALGVVLGSSILTRQQGFFLMATILLVAMLLYLARPNLGRAGLKAAAIACVIAFALGGWFYVRQWIVHGNAYEYVHRRPAYSLRNLPLSFWLGTGGRQVFRDPVRPAFEQHLWPMFYSEAWGDYYCYFLIRGDDLRDQTVLRGPDCAGVMLQKRGKYWLRTNRFEMGPFLGRVNLVSLLPSLLLLAGFFMSVRSVVSLRHGEPNAPGVLHALLTSSVIVTMASYLFLLSAYPSRHGGLAKATYVICAFPALAILGADIVARLRLWAPRAATVLQVALVLVFLHNVPAYFSVYGPRPPTGASWGLRNLGQVRSSTASPAPVAP